MVGISEDREKRAFRWTECDANEKVFKDDPTVFGLSTGASGAVMYRDQGDC